MSEHLTPTATERKRIWELAARYDGLIALRWVPEDQRPYPMLFSRDPTPGIKRNGMPIGSAVIAVIGR